MNYDLTIFRPDNDPESIFFAAVPPKGSVRGREDDLLFAQLNPSGQKVFDVEEVYAALETNARQFHKTSGSVTKAMRVFVDGLNRFFQQSNSHFSEPETWQTASLCLGVIHLDTLFVGQVGLCSAHVMRPGEDETFFDPDLDRRGLGAATVVNPRYFQTTLKGNEALLLLPDPETHLMDDAEADAQTRSVYMRFSRGSGKLDFRALSERTSQVPAPEAAAEEPEAAIEGGALEEAAEADTLPYTPSLAEDLFSQAVLLPDETEDDSDQIFAEAEPAPLPEPAQEPEPGEPEIPPVEELEAPAPADSVSAESSEHPKPDFGVLKGKALHGVAAGASWLRRAEEKAESVLKAGKTSSHTELQTGMTTELSPWVKILIAVIVPLVIVALASLVYFNRGEDHQYQYLLAQAKASVANAPLMQTKELQRDAWEQALNWINQAGAYQENAEIKALRSQALTALDAIDGTRRLQFVPAYAASLYPNWKIKAILSLNNDLYLLDQASGSVKLLRLRSNGYELVDQFNCGPGEYDGIEVGKLVDMISIPLNNPAKAPVLGIDAAGNLIYCSANNPTSAVRLIPPETGWAGLKSIVFDSNRLYVLDPENNALWKYRGLTSNFSDPADAYFGEQKLDLTTVVDFAVSGEDIFLLHEDGHSTHCLSSSITGNDVCDEPYPYMNTEGVDNDLDVSAFRFARLSYSPPPDPSVYYLEADQVGLYQFSLRLNLNKVLRFGTGDGSQPTGKASAFYVSPDRRVFLAFGNQLYHAVLP